MDRLIGMMLIIAAFIVAISYTAERAGGIEPPPADTRPKCDPNQLDGILGTIMLYSVLVVVAVVVLMAIAGMQL